MPGQVGRTRLSGANIWIQFLAGLALTKRKANDKPWPHNLQLFAFVTCFRYCFASPNAFCLCWLLLPFSQSLQFCLPLVFTVIRGQGKSKMVGCPKQRQSKTNWKWNIGPEWKWNIGPENIVCFGQWPRQVDASVYIYRRAVVAVVNA